MLTMSVTTPSPVSLTFLFWFFMFTTTSFVATPSTSSPDTFIYGGCSQLKYAPGSPYESNVNSLLTSMVNSAMFSSFNKFTISTSSNPCDTVCGLFQCRGDITNSDCAHCVAYSVSQLSVLCGDKTGGMFQLESCFVKYDNTTFLGVEDKSVVVKECGPSIGFDSEELTRRDAVLAYLAGGVGFYRVGSSGRVRGVAQCVGDLSANQCQDCLSDAIGRLRSECGTASWGATFLAKCYARYSGGGDHRRSRSRRGSKNNDNKIKINRMLKISIWISTVAGGASSISVTFYVVKKVHEKRVKDNNKNSKGRNNKDKKNNNTDPEDSNTDTEKENNTDPEDSNTDPKDNNTDAVEECKAGVDRRFCPCHWQLNQYGIPILDEQLIGHERFCPCYCH